MENKFDLKIGDVVQVKESGWGFASNDIGKWVEIIRFGKYGGGQLSITVREYDQPLVSIPYGIDEYRSSIKSFGKNPMILLNTKDERYDNRELGCDEDFVKVVPNTLKEYTTKHYDTYYQLTDKDIEEGKIRVDAYWVAKQWKIGSRDDSGALFHNLKTIARFGEKNSVEREIKALYNQTKALARVYGVELD